MDYDLAKLAQVCNGKVIGDPDTKIKDVAALDLAETGHISFCSSNKNSKYLKTTRASAVLLSEDIAGMFSGNTIVVTEPHLCFVQIARLFHPQKELKGSIHKTAVVSKGTTIPESATIGPHAVVEEGVNLGEHAYIGAGCIIGRGVSIGSGTVIHANVVIKKDCQVGRNCVIHPGVVIGGDGFGFAKSGSVWEKMPQLCRVLIGDDVEIGANSTIDRGALRDTIIHKGVKIDNLVQIGHNVEIGENTAIAACAAIAGSAIIGKRCSIGGCTGIADHIEIVDDVTIAGKSMVGKSITEPGVYSSSIRVDTLKNWQKNSARINQLDDMAKRLANLEKKVDKK